TSERTLDALDMGDDYYLNCWPLVLIGMNIFYPLGGMDSVIINNDVRINNHIVEKYEGHQLEVCGLNWSSSGQQLASGGNDNLLHTWDCSMASSNSPTQWLHRLDNHTAAVKALA
ncbi:hypothetical protein IFM89_023626, partial [Coptis chinensis]